jgi:hypothetical protein
MDRASLANIADALRNVSGAISERLRHEGAGKAPPFAFLAECFDAEAHRLRREGQDGLADALTVLRDVEGVVQ